MTVVVCIDSNGGIMFNSRRQSQDKLLRARIISLLSGRKLVVSPYTSKQFSYEDQQHLLISKECYRNADADSICFAEDETIDISDNNIDSVVIFKWNRIYPADTFFDFRLLEKWRLVISEDFAGNSHEKITMEVYAR